MTLGFARFSYWICGEKDHEAQNSSFSTAADFPSGFREPDCLKFSSVNGHRSNSRRVKRKWQSREERRVDKEYDIVLVPSDGGGCLSGSESEDSDWSIGWLEPHGSDFRSENETENSFAVLVPCYGRDPSGKKVETSKNHFFGSVDLVDEFTDNKNYIEEWLSSLQSFDRVITA